MKTFGRSRLDGRRGRHAEGEEAFLGFKSPP